MEEEFMEVLEAFREFRGVISCDDWDRYCEVRELDTLLNLLLDISERQPELSQRTKALAGSANSAMEP